MENVTKAIIDAAVIYGVPMADDQIKFYLDILAQSGVSDNRLAVGVVRACAACKFMPKPADILEHLPPFDARQTRASDDDELNDDDRAFSKAAGPIFTKWLEKQITKEEMVDQMCQAAKDLGIEHGVRRVNFYESGEA